MVHHYINMKRKNYISFDELFMGIAKLSALRSKDPATQIGVCIVNTKNRLVSIGYNGLPNGMSDDEFSWDKKEKHDYVIHAEMNAILNATVDLNGCIMFMYSDKGYYPCSNCAKGISQSGIQEVVLNSIGDAAFINSKYMGIATMRMFKDSGVNIRVLMPNDYMMREG